MAQIINIFLIGGAVSAYKARTAEDATSRSREQESTKRELMQVTKHCTFIPGDIVNSNFSLMCIWKDLMRRIQLILEATAGSSCCNT